MDDGGNPAQRGQCLARLDPPLELCEVPPRTAGEGDALRSGIQCQDPVCGVRGRGDLQSGKLVDGDVTRGDHERERLFVPEQGSAFGAEVHGQTEELRGTPGEEQDGSRRPRRCEGGVGVTYESPGSSQRSARSLDEEGTDYENEDETPCSSVEAEAATTNPVPGGSDGPGNQKLFSCLESQDDPNAIFLVDDLARRLWQEKNFDHDVCKRLVQRVCLECQAARKRKINEGTASVALGAYSHGNHYGVIKKSYMYPNVALYINKYMKTHGAKGQWTSFQLGWNCPTGPHKDVHNHERSYNWTISVGSFTGGRLWLEPNSSEVLDHPPLHQPVDLADGTQAIGEVIDTRERMYQFDPKRQHAVEAWSGDRAVITVYTTRGIGQLSRQECDVLRSFGFPIGVDSHGPRDPASEPWEQEHRTRPKKSVRRSLWKGAQRASALFTLCLAAATSFLSEVLPRGHSPEHAALLEVGGIDLTCDAVENGDTVLEPLSWNDFLDSTQVERIDENILTLKPHVVWIQGRGKGAEATDRLHQTLECQLSTGECSCTRIMMATHSGRQISSGC